MIKKIISIINDYGIKWSFFRFLYFLKIKTLIIFPKAEILFEKKVKVKRIELFEFELNEIENFLMALDNSFKEEIVKKANNAIVGKINGFSSISLDYGNPINWQYNPLTNEFHDKNIKWFKISDFDKRVGDIKVIWEASRLTHFTLFFRAYIITKDKKYYEAFSKQLDDWLIENPYSLGANYKCGQEATIRMVNVLMTYSVFNQFGLTDNIDYENVKKIIEGSYKKVLSNFFYAHKCIINNHTFTEILGRIIGAWATVNDKELKRSMNLMDKEIKRQFSIDGGFKQFSNNYHRFTLQIFEVLFKIENKLGFSIKEKLIINKSVLLLFNIMNDNGNVPNYGSNDGALIFPLSESSYRDYRPTLNTIYAQINNKKLFEDDIHTEEMLWFHKKVELDKTITKKAMKLDEFGMYSFRSNDTLAVVHLNNYKSRPAHMDQLHFELWHKNIDVFSDLGTYSYASELGNHLTKNEAHNTVYIPGKSQMNKSGAFMVYDWSKVIKCEYNPNKKFVGKMLSKNGYLHERTINKINNGFEIIDIVQGNDIKEYYINFHTHLDISVFDNSVLLSDNNKILATLITENEVYIKEEIRSLYYLRTEKIKNITIKVKGKEKAKTIIELA